ncbi:MAG: benzoate/H(+) symporter BenE family transporter [Burkholderiaceae bacterium]|jgi:benzoate membrane transport protein|nr:benzoate/H(+) symporter BenE family transporter [Burkholderiaceae bacterium]
MRFFKDLSLPAVTAGFVAVLVSFTSAVAIVFQAAQAFGATPQVIASWMWALGIGIGLTTALPSLWWKKPVMVAWSTPGAAVLATAGAGFGMGEAVGAFLVSALLVTLAGATGWFERAMNRLPIAIASALLAGVLARFGIDAFLAVRGAPVLVLVMLAAYLVGRRAVPRYAVLIALAAGMAIAAAHGQLAWNTVHVALARPVFTMPVFSVRAAVGLALPLFLVTMASQNLPGVAAIRAAGYDLPVSKLITITGLATLVFAPFGGYALNLSAITASICLGREASEDPARRYTAAVCCGLFYVLVGCFGVAVAGLLAAFPQALVAAIAGLALLGTIGNGLVLAVRDPNHCEAAVITFLVTLSGVTLAGIGSAFWGVIAGALALGVQRLGRRQHTSN